MTEATPDLKTITRAARDPAATAEQLQGCAGQGESIDRLLAKHPNVSAQLLEQLSHSSDRATRKAVTLHPNTPKDALLKLAPQFPGDFFQNPAFDWLLIEHPNLMFDIGGGVLKNVLKRAECPQSFMAWAAAHGSEQERLAVAMNPQAQADVLQAIERKGGKAAQAAQQHANHPLASAEGDLESAFRKAVEQVIAEEFTADDLPTLAQWPALSLGERLDTKACIDYANHRRAPPALTVPILRALASDPVWPVRLNVARLIGTPPDILGVLADDANSTVREQVAMNPSTPAASLTKLAGDSGRDVRRAVAQNPATPADILAELAADSDSWVRHGIADNPITPADTRAATLTKLAGDSDSGVRAWVGNKPATPATVLMSLADDPDRQVRIAVAMNLSTPAAIRSAILSVLAGDSDGFVRCAVAANPATPSNVLATLANDWLSFVSSAAVENSAIGAEILCKLGSDADSCVRAAVARNPATPVARLTELAGDSQSHVRSAVALNAAVEPNILTTLSRDAELNVRSAVAGNPAAPVGVLTQLAADSDRDLRWALACNPATPVDIKTKLVADLCAYAQKEAFEPRNSEKWTSQLAKLKPKDADLIRACKDGDVLYLPDRLAEQACRKKDLAWRVLGLSHRLASPDDLVKRSRSTEWVERMAVARNPNTPPNMIEALRKDPHRLVARQAEATALIKSGATERQAQLLQEMPAASTGPTGQALVEEANIRLRARTKPDLRLFGSQWAGCLGPQWLSLLDAGTQANLEQVLPDSMKQAMAEFWVGSSVPADEVAAVHLPSVLALLAKRSRKEGVQKLVAASINAPAEVLARLATSKFDDVRINVAANPATPAAVLAILSGDAAFLVRHRVAVNPSTPAETLTKLADDLTVRRRVAENPATPIALLTHLAKNAEAWVRVAVAGNQSSPDDIRPGILSELASDPDPAVRCAVAANPATPGAALTMLAADASVPVRCAFAANPSAPADKLPTVLTALAGDEDAKVRKAAAENPATTLDVLIKLAGDDRFDVRERVAHNPATPADIAATLSAARAEGMARNASRADVDVRLFVAQDLDTPPETLRTLAGDVSWLVCTAAVSNPNAPADVLVAPTGDANADMRRSVMRRCTELRSALSADPPTPEQSAVIQSWIAELQAGLAEPADVSDSEFRMAFDALGLMPAEGDKRAIAKAVKSKDWLERAAATYAAGIQPSLLKVLLEDPVEAVRQRAVARLRVVGA
jgi:hypothetical protein